jgi:hypothetical protein
MSRRRQAQGAASGTQRFLARVIVWSVLLAALWLVTGTAAWAQGADTTRRAARDSGAPAAADTTPAASQVAPTGAAATDSAHLAAASLATRDTSVEPQTATDTALGRVRSLLSQGQTTAARALVDSLVVATPAGSVSYAGVLYARATLATNADSAESDYRRVTVEYAASPRAADALLRLAQLELARGDRAQAAAHLDRLVREQLPNQTGIGFARTELQVGLAYFDLQDPTHACAALVEARGAAPSTDVELRNRIDYNVQRCPPPGLVSTQARDSARGSGTSGVDSLAKHQASRRGAVATGAGATSKRSPPPAGASAALSSNPSATAPSSAAHSRKPGYTVQVAAYQTHAAAAALVDGLAHRGYVARIFGASAPFRVRVGHFATQVQADSAAQSLRKKGITAFVTPGETGE